MYDIDEKLRHGVIGTVTVMDCARWVPSLKQKVGGGFKLNGVASEME